MNPDLLTQARKKNEKTTRKTLSAYFLSVSILIIFIIQLFPLKPLFADDNRGSIPRKYIDTVAVSAIVEDYNSDRVLWEKNSDKAMYPASITKIMTAIIVLEEAENLEETIRISENARGRNFSSINFRVNDKITVGDLLKAALVSSNNNATIALAEHISGSEKEFVKLMNRKAKEIGALNTNFENTNGLDSENPGHRSTAKDLVMIAKYCMANEKFREIVSLKEARIYLSGKEIIIQNTNSLLDGDFIKGIKTGYTNNAGFCLITYSKKEDVELLCTVLGSSLYGRNYDTLRLLDWVYDNYRYEKIISKEEPVSTAYAGNDFSNASFDLFPKKDFTLLLNRAEDRIFFDFDIDRNIKFPVLKDKSYGKMTVFLNGSRLEEFDLCSRSEMKSPEIRISHYESSYGEIVKLLLIFTLSFYFSAFTFIIIKNLIRLKSN
ncbi:MAG TPA: D-alanyl-D-alanine carboxypeptidase [Actinobacteria bacterium]|nr:D-alanyl-D-alanine carboxypeptidase [Actinomycetota bacterium]